MRQIASLGCLRQIASLSCLSCEGKGLIVGIAVAVFIKCSKDTEQRSHSVDCGNTAWDCGETRQPRGEQQGGSGAHAEGLACGGQGVRRAQWGRGKGRGAGEIQARYGRGCTSKRERSILPGRWACGRCLACAREHARGGAMVAAREEGGAAVAARPRARPRAVAL